MTEQATIHMASLIRLQIAVTALQRVSGPIADTRGDLLDLVRRDPENNAALAEMAARLDGLSEIVSAALEIAWGARADIPEALQSGVLSLMEVDAATRILDRVRA